MYSTVSWSLLAILAMCGLSTAGCITAPRLAVVGETFHLGAAPVLLAPIDDPDHALTSSEADELLTSAVAALARHVPRLGAPGLVTHTADPTYIVRLRIGSFHESRPVLAILVGFGEGRAGYRAEARIERAGALAEEQALAASVFTRERYSYDAIPGGPRAAMMREIEGAMDRFIKRHR